MFNYSKLTNYSVIIITVLVFFSLIPYLGHSQLRDSVIGKINIQESDNLILINAHADNEEPIFKNNLYYNLLALKKSASGNYSSNRQEGEFSLNPNESKNLSEIRLSLNSGEELRIYLFIKQNDVLVSKDSLLILPQIEKEKEVVKEVDFEMKGIVVEDVLTKIGKDFHDYFYQAYSNSGDQYPFIINIKEKPYFGRSSIITIEIEDQTIFEFFSKPDEEFLREAVRSSLQNIKQFSIQRKLLYKNSRI